jgi:hypothetical protein
MTARMRLPDRRRHESVGFECNGFKYVAGFGWFGDGRLAEVFINSAKTGTAIDVAARDAAITASIAFQHGASPDELRHALTRNSDGSAGGPLAMALDLVEGRTR